MRQNSRICGKTGTMDWIYLSPHFDDAVLSCGGLVWEQSQAGRRVRVWTICAGDPDPGALSPFAQSLHERWKTGSRATAKRREEDALACRLLGAIPRHFPFADCIYRRSPGDGSPYYPSQEAIFGPLHPAESRLVDDLADLLQRELPDPVNLVCPLTIGGHADHRLVRAAAEALKLPLWYYADYPYVLAEADGAEGLRDDLEPVLFPVSVAGMEAWQGAIAAYASQISSFWPSLEAMRAAVRAYHDRNGGIYLWRQAFSTGEEGVGSRG